MKRAIPILLLLAGVPARAQDEGEDFSRKDRTALLYQTKFLFTGDQVPIVTVGLVEGEREVSFDAEGPLEFWPEGYGGPSIRLGAGRTTCKARIDQGQAARIRFWVALNRLPARDLGGIRRERGAWEGQGLKVRTFQRGSIFGFYGRVLDNRTVTLVEDEPSETMAEAVRRRDALAARTGIATLEVFEEVVDRPNGVIEVQCAGQNARMSFPGMVMVGSADGRPVTLRSVEYGKGFAWHGREDRSYRGRLVLTADREGRLAVVNAVDAETLLKGLVPSEIYVDAPAAALEAQAIVARGELFAKLGNRHTADPFMVCADVHCQVYKGVGREDPRTSRAVDATRGRMLFHGDGLADSVYGASCGGHSESGEAVWQGSGHDYLVGVPDHPGGTRFFAGERPTGDEVARFLADPPPGTYCGATRYGKESFRWTRFVSEQDVRQGVARETGKDPGEIRGLRILERGVSGRVTRLEVEGAAGAQTLSPELRIRKALGGLRSSLFVFEPAREGGQAGFRFTGGGFGHGVGMCQVGAIGRAQAGQGAGEILKAYYPGTDLIQIY